MRMNGDLDWVSSGSFITAERGLVDPEAKRLLRNITLAARIDVAVLLLIVIDMTVKPFS
jgi:hypothetical protein